MNIYPTDRNGSCWIGILLILALISIQALADERRIIHIGGSAESIYDTRIADVEILISLLFTEMFNGQDEQLNIKIYDSDLSLSNQLTAGNLDAAFMNPVFYLDHIDHLNSQFTYAVRYGSTVKMKYVLLVRRDSGITTLADLKNKKLIIPSGHMVGQRFLDVELLRAGLPVTEQTFSELRRTSETNAAIINLFFGNVDAALVTDFSYEVASELNRQIPMALQIIRTSLPLVHMVVSVREGFPLQLIEKLIPFTDAFNEHPRMQFLKKTFRFEGVQKIRAEDMIEIDKLNREYSQLKRERLLQ
jgi:ABC-type phosphate/phosphonate transport system substrate-binding protein